MSYITQEHLAFLSAAVKEFQGDSTLHTYRDEDLGLIALREDRIGIPFTSFS